MEIEGENNLLSGSLKCVNLAQVTFRCIIYAIGRQIGGALLFGMNLQKKNFK